MKKVLLSLLAVIVIVGALAGAGFVGYRIGFNQVATNSGNVPFWGRTERMNPNFMPMPRFGGDFTPRFQPYHSPMMGRGDFGFNFFSPLRILWNLAILALIVWFVYWLFTKSGWQITRQANNEPEIPQVKTEG